MVLLLATVGVAVVLQHTPSAVMAAPPVAVMLPPVVAVVPVTAVTAAVLSVGRLARAVKVTWVP